MKKLSQITILFSIAFVLVLVSSNGADAVVGRTFSTPGKIGNNNIYLDTINQGLKDVGVDLDIFDNVPTDPDQKFGYRLQDTKTSFDFGQYHVDIKLYCNDNCSNHRKKVKGTAEKYAQEAYANGEKIIPKQSCNNSYYVVRVTNTLGINSPTGLTPSCSANGSSVNLSWNAVEGASYYKVALDDTKDGWNESLAGSTQFPGDRFNGSVSGTSWSSNIISGDSYSWWVSSCNSVGCTNPSYGIGFKCGSTPVNDNDGVCGSASGQVSVNPPTSNLCSRGTPSSVNSTQFLHTWTCSGTDGGRDQSCSASTGKNTGDNGGDGNNNGGGNNGGGDNNGKISFLNAEISPSVVNDDNDKCYITWETQNAMTCVLNGNFVSTSSDDYGVFPGDYILTCSDANAESDSRFFRCLLNPSFNEF